MTAATITPAQCRAARALLNLTQAELADLSKLSRKTVADFEQSNRQVHKRSLEGIHIALSLAGAEFLTDGVRLRRRAA